MLYCVKLNKVKSNLILRIPKEISDVLGLREGVSVTLKLKDRDIVINA